MKPAPSLFPARPPRHAAMKDVEGSDEDNGRARSGRGVKSSDQPRSPLHEPRHQSDSRRHHRHSSRSEPSSTHRRHRSRDRDRDEPRRHSPRSARRPADEDDLIPRFRKNKSHRSESKDRSRRRSRTRSRSRERGGDGASQSSSKRHRSRSRSFDVPHRKKSRREHSPSHHHRDTELDHHAKKRRRRSPYDGPESPTSHHARSRRSPSPTETNHRRSRRRSSSRSPGPSEAGLRRVTRDTDLSRSAHHRRSLGSRSPASESRHPKPPPRAPRVGPASPSAADNSAVDLSRRPAKHDQPPRSPKAHFDRRHRDRSTEPFDPARSDIEDDMASRSNYRGGYNSTYPHKPHGNDSRGYPHSPHHGGPYHDSPSHSPYGAGRPPWNGQQYSPQQ